MFARQAAGARAHLEPAGQRPRPTRRAAPRIYLDQISLLDPSLWLGLGACHRQEVGLRHGRLGESRPPGADLIHKSRPKKRAGGARRPKQLAHPDTINRADDAPTHATEQIAYSLAVSPVTLSHSFHPHHTRAIDARHVQVAPKVPPGLSSSSSHVHSSVRSSHVRKSSAPGPDCSPVASISPRP